MLVLPHRLFIFFGLDNVSQFVFLIGFLYLSLRTGKPPLHLRLSFGPPSLIAFTKVLLLRFSHLRRFETPYVKPLKANFLEPPSEVNFGNFQNFLDWFVLCGTSHGDSLGPRVFFFDALPNVLAILPPAAFQDASKRTFHFSGFPFF